MSREDPFAIFKPYTTNFKNRKIANAFNQQERMIKPFYSLGFILGDYSFFLLYNLTFIVTDACGLTNFNYTLYWLIIDIIAIPSTLIIAYALDKFPRYNNIIGFLTILLIYILRIESNRVQNPIYVTLFWLSIYQIILIMFWVEYMSSLICGIIAQLIGVTYAAMRLVTDDNFHKWQAWEAYIIGGFIMFMLFSVALVGFTKWRKITFYDIYVQHQMQKNWKMAMDGLPSGIAIIKNTNLVYHNKKLSKLLHIPLELSDDSRIERISEKVRDMVPWVFDLNEEDVVGDEEMMEDTFTDIDSVVSITRKSILFEEERSYILGVQDVSFIRDLNEAKTQMKYKSMLMATFTHDMRTPVNSITAMLEIIKTQIPPNLMKYLNIANSSCFLLLHLIHDILDYSKIENNQIILRNELFDLTKAIEEVCDMLSFQIESKGINLIIEEMKSKREVYTDRRRYQQILLNLVSNSLKFTRSGEISIKTSFAKEEIFTSIEDTGIGIREYDLDKLFKAFGMLPNNQDINQYGSGLGLYLCKNLCELMGGNIHAYSKFGEGSTFIFSFTNALTPVMAEEENNILLTTANYGNVEEGGLNINSPINHNLHENMSTQNMSFEPLRLNNISLEDLEKSREDNIEKKVLIVDDSPFNQFSIVKLLEILGVQSSTANNGEDAINMIQGQEDKFKFILMDCNMPFMDGFQASRELRRLFQENMITRRLPIIGLTGYENQETMEKCFASGMIQIFTKPISLDQLRELVETYE